MKKLKYAFAISNLIILLISFQDSLHSDNYKDTSSNSKENFVSDKVILSLNNGTVLVHNSNKIEEIDIKGFVKNIFQQKNVLYYLKTPTDTDLKKWYIGYMELNSKTSFESELGIEMENRIIKRFLGSDGISIILTEDPQDCKNTLYRIDINRMDVSRLDDVYDAVIIKGVLFLIQKRLENKHSECYYLNVNGRIIPLSLKERPVFKDVVDDRILFISNGRETELIDIQNNRSLYLYSTDSQYLIPGNFNLIVETFDDNLQKDIKKSVFYKIHINGKESGRTETGIPNVNKSFNTLIEPNRYYIVALERWELDRIRKRYFRANNIRQPHPIKLFIPDNRVLKIIVIFNGKTYSFEKEIVRSE